MENEELQPTPLDPAQLEKTDALLESLSEDDALFGEEEQQPQAAQPQPQQEQVELDGNNKEGGYDDKEEYFVALGFP